MDQSTRIQSSDSERNNEPPGKTDNFLAAKKPVRLHYLDWLRVLAVAGVFYAHTLSIFDLLSWHISQTREDALIIFGTEWGMALFFFLAGASAWFALDTRTGRQFIGERFRRLAIPFVVGVLLFSPPQSYLLGLNRPPYPLSFFQYYLYFFSHIHLSWNPQFFAAYGFHLWFLALLFLFSAIAVLPFLYLNHARDQRFIVWLSKVCARPGGTLLLLVPLALIQITLRPVFPAYQGWTDFFIWFLYFLYGYFLLSRNYLAQAIRKQSVVTLLIGVVSLATLLITIYGSGFLAVWDDTPGYSLKYELYQLLWTIIGWSWMLFVLAFGMRFLETKNAVITYLNEAILPFYVLHYFIIVLITYSFMRWWIMPPVLMFLVVSTLSLMTTLGVYEIAIRRVPLARRLFGMKEKEQGATKSV